MIQSKFKRIDKIKSKDCINFGELYFYSCNLSIYLSVINFCLGQSKWHEGVFLGLKQCKAFIFVLSGQKFYKRETTTEWFNVIYKFPLLHAVTFCIILLHTDECLIANLFSASLPPPPPLSFDYSHRFPPTQKKNIQFHSI